jgi:hypothetical protein
MPITLTCPCGRRLSVPAERAGKQVPCGGCGRALSVPALGIMVEPAPAAAPEPKRDRSTVLPWILIAVGVLFILLAGASWYTLARPGAPAPEKSVVVLPDELPRAVPAETAAEKPARPLVVQPPITKPLDVKPQTAQPVVPPSRTVARQVPELVPPPTLAKKPPAVVERPPLLWRLKEGDTFRQDLLITRKPNLRMSGVEFASLLQYRVLSRFQVQKVWPDGSRTVQQKVEDAKLLQADALTQPVLAGPVAQLPGTTFTLHLNPRLEVTQLLGVPEPAHVAAVQGPLGQGFQMTSLLDADGWKEMAQATFFQLEQTPQPQQRWARPMSHGWGPLGRWDGQVHYQYQGAKGDTHRIAYALQLVHRPPTGAAPGLPFQLAGAQFQPPEAAGVIVFDTGRGRVSGAEERFRIRGRLQVVVLGQSVPVEVDEEQVFHLRVVD